MLTFQTERREVPPERLVKWDCAAKTKVRPSPETRQSLPYPQDKVYEGLCLSAPSEGPVAFTELELPNTGIHTNIISFIRGETCSGVSRSLMSVSINEMALLNNMLKLYQEPSSLNDQPDKWLQHLPRFMHLTPTIRIFLTLGRLIDKCNFSEGLSASDATSSNTALTHQHSRRRPEPPMGKGSLGHVSIQQIPEASFN